MLNTPGRDTDPMPFTSESGAAYKVTGGADSSKSVNNM